MGWWQTILFAVILLLTAFSAFLVGCITGTIYEQQTKKPRYVKRKPDTDILGAQKYTKH